MPKRKLCTAITQKGRRCRNPGNPNTSGLCALHANSRRELAPHVVASSETDPGIGLTVAATVEMGGGTLENIPQAIGQVMRIVEFVGSHWPLVHHLARHRVLTPKPNAIANLIKDCERMIKSGHKDANLAARFERWFESLPGTVKVEAETEFGDIRSVIEFLRDSP